MKAEKIYDQTFTARDFNTSPVTISGLEGDLYDYHMIFQVAANSSYTFFRYYPNNDTTSNYRRYYMWGRGSSVLGQVLDATSSTYIISTGSAGTNPHLAILSFTGSSGDERYIDIFSSLNDNTNSAVSKWSNYWKNTVDEMTSIKIDASNTVTHDAHIVLYRTPKEASQEKWELVDKLSWSASSTEQAFTTDGNTDIQYRLVWKGDQELNIELNNDATSNYTRQYLQNSAGTISAANASNTSIVTDGIEAEVIINAESGVKRLCTSTASNTSAAQQSERAIWWGNTADNLSSIDCTPAASATGTAKLYRSKNPNTIGDTLPFEMVEEESFSSTDWSAGSTYTVSGDDVLLYKIEGLLSNASGDIEIRMELNSDTAANYPEQLLKGDTSTASAASATRNYIVLAKLQNGDQAQFNHYLYPKSGENRPMLTECSYDENALEKLAHWWSNSADSISSIKIYASTSNAITGTLKLSRIMSKPSWAWPDQIAGLDFWIRAEDGYTDISSNSATVTNNGSTIAAADINGFDAFSFDGTNDDIVMTSAPTYSLPFSWFIVYKSDVSDANYRTMASFGSTGGTKLLFSKDNSNNDYVNNSGSGSGVTGNATGTAYKIVIGTVDASENVTLYEGGSSVATGNPGGTYSGGQNVTLGSFNSVSQYWQGKIADFGTYDSELSAADVKRLDNGLKIRYNL